MGYKRFIIDVGHGLHNLGQGSYDPGAVANDTAEHTLVAGFAEAARYALENQFEIIIVNEGERGAVVEAANIIYQKGDVFLSLHINSSTSPKASGAEVIYAENAPGGRKEEAEAVAAKVSKVLRIPNRGALPDSKTPNGKKKGLLVLRETKAPALLIEFGFITNKTDLKAMKERGTLALCESIRLLAKE